MTRLLPRRFLITYAAAFGLLYFFGQFAAGRAADANWTRSPFQVRKGGPAIDFVIVYLMRSPSTGGIDFIVASENARGHFHAYDDQWRTPEERDGYLGFVLVSHTRDKREVGSFMYENRSIFGAEYDIANDADVPGEALNEASRLGVRRARIAYDTSYIADDSMPLSQQYELPRGIVKHHSYDFLIPPWLILSLFTFVPLAAAWTFTSATTRSKPDEPRLPKNKRGHPEGRPR